MPEVERAVAAVRRAHTRVHGTSHRGIDYHADDADLTSWVHNALNESFVVSYEAFGPRRLTAEEADRYVVEQQALGELMGADVRPGSRAELRRWISEHPAVGPSPGAEAAVPYIASPPAGPLMRMGYKLLFWAAAATIPARLRSALGIRRVPGARLGGRALAWTLRAVMGSSPAWLAAIERSGAQPPAGVRFRRPVPGIEPTR